MRGVPSKGRFERCACCAKARLIPDLHHRACYLRTHSRQGLLFAGWVKGLCSMGGQGAGISRQSLLLHWWQALQRKALSGLLRTESGSSNAMWRQQSRR